jgi:hypothetical protein
VKGGQRKVEHKPLLFLLRCDYAANTPLRAMLP